jgi:hypothetical protein
MCGNLGRLDRGDPASVVVLISDDHAEQPDSGCAPGRRTVRLAHPGCSDSAIRETPAARSGAPRPVLPGTAWLRPADTTPAAVLVLAAPRSTPRYAAGQPEPAFPATLLDHGFAVLASGEDVLPPVSALAAQYAAGYLTVRNRFGAVAWEGALRASQDWVFAAVRAKTLGLVLAAGLPAAEAPQPVRWPALDKVIAAGNAVGAAIGLVQQAAAGTSRPPLCGRPPSYDRAGKPERGRAPVARLELSGDPTPLRLTTRFGRSGPQRSQRDDPPCDIQPPGAAVA